MAPGCQSTACDHIPVHRRPTGRPARSGPPPRSRRATARLARAQKIPGQGRRHYIENGEPFIGTDERARAQKNTREKARRRHRPNMSCGVAIFLSVTYIRFMSIMNAEVYDALVTAGAPEDKARAAASSIADHDRRFSRIEAELVLIKWMSGFIITGVAALVIKTFF